MSLYLVSIAIDFPFHCMHLVFIAVGFLFHCTESVTLYFMLLSGHQFAMKNF